MTPEEQARVAAFLGGLYGAFPPHGFYHGDDPVSSADVALAVLTKLAALDRKVKLMHIGPDMGWRVDVISSVDHAMVSAYRPTAQEAVFWAALNT